jgi:hypothetical protein
MANETTTPSNRIAIIDPFKDAPPIVDLSDVLFFRHHKTRRHRVRRASPGEAKWIDAMQDRLGDRRYRLPPDLDYFVVAKFDGFLGSDLRYFAGPDNVYVYSLPECAARGVFEQTVDTQFPWSGRPRFASLLMRDDEWQYIETLDEVVFDFGDPTDPDFCTGYRTWPARPPGDGWSVSKRNYASTVWRRRVTVPGRPSIDQEGA